VIVYQEQVMQIASGLAGFTLGEADKLRRAMGKKKRDVMGAQRDRFVKGCTERGITERNARKIFELMEFFAGYGFNKAHSTAYALVAYQTAWLKAHYPRHFMAALLTAERENTDNIVKYIGTCREMGIAVLAPDINTSEVDFTVEADGIRFGLSAVKNVGENAVRAMLQARERVGPFGSLAQVCREVDGRHVNKRVLESLIRAGAMDGLGPNRATIHAAVDGAMESGQRAVRDRESGQAALFGGPGEAPADVPLRPLPEWDERDLLAYEKETLGFYLAGHPLKDYDARIKGLISHTAATLKEVKHPCRATLAGLVTALKKRRTRKGDQMAVFQLEGLQGTVEVVVFPEVYARHRTLLEEDTAILLIGSVEIADEQRRLLAESLLPLDEAEEKRTKEVVIAIPDRDVAEPEFARVRDLIRERPGPCPVFLEVAQPCGFRSTLKVSNSLKVSPSHDLTMALEEVLGKGTVRLR
jgi:DNA polymerase-3 subunit alpha